MSFLYTGTTAAVFQNKGSFRICFNFWNMLFNVLHICLFVALKKAGGRLLCPGLLDVKLV